jgi:DNA repair exonuclease SbcCD ATPase subunit
MNDAQWDAILKTVTDSQSFVNSSDNVGSRREPQEPENKKFAKEVRHLSEHNTQQSASPQRAQGVVYVAPGETSPKQVTYEDFMQQLQQLEKQITQTSAPEAEVEALKKKVAELEGEVAKRATKRSLSKKISELSKQLQQPQEDGNEGEDSEAESARRASGKGIVAVDEMQRDALGNYDWFKDLLKAHKRLTGFQ